MDTGNGITEKETFSSTGMPSLDHVLDGIRAGDNIVWQVNAIEDYIPFVHAFCKKSHADEIPLVYFRFGHHEQLLPEGIDANVFQLHPEAGFETFLAKVFSIIEEFGKGACYVFDNLSDLADDWYSDLMLGNFFMLACPYLYDFDTATYFAILRNRHGATVIDRIQGTAQIIIDVFNHDGKTFIHPLKVYDRCSPTMYMLHEKHGDDFKPVIASGLISEIFTTLEQPWVDLTARRLDVWARTLRRAKRKLAEFDTGSIERHDMDGLKRRLVLMMIAREKQLIDLSMEYLDVGDLLAIGRRIIGSGLIGGKSVGMIMARAILEKEEKVLLPILEVHDSFFIGSDVFYTFLVENDMWWKRRVTTKPRSFLEGLDELTLRIHEGHFREEILEQFSLMLKYFGQSPIIVRSSSLLEDAYGNAFSGKYESVFCANQGTLEQRLGDFINAVKRVYASSISRDALMYRKKRDLLEKDEQMALLVQRVSGSLKGNYFFPDLAGVAFSFNPYAWDDSIDPRAGVARLVLGLGTRAVERKDDYTRLVALNAPDKQVPGNRDDPGKFTQKKVDLIDINANSFTTVSFRDLFDSLVSTGFLEMVTTKDLAKAEMLARRHRPGIAAYHVSFKGILQGTNLVSNLRVMLDAIEKAYGTPVDVEFTANFDSTGGYRLNLLQCRPFQVRMDAREITPIDGTNTGEPFLHTQGPIIGPSVSSHPGVLIMVRPKVFGRLAPRQRFAIARAIGKITHHPEISSRNIMILGPGRWGTSTVSLGIPVTFAEIENVSIIGEIAEMHDGLIPDVSLGTHFFNDLVEMDMIYFAVYPGKKGYMLDVAPLEAMENQVSRYLPGDSLVENAIIVLEFTNDENDRIAGVNKTADQKVPRGKHILGIFMDTLEQEGRCYLLRG